MTDPKRERDAVKQEDSGRRWGGSYVLGRSHNRIPNSIMRDVKTLEKNKYFIYIYVSRIYSDIYEHEVSMMEDPDYDSRIYMVKGSY